MKIGEVIKVGLVPNPKNYDGFYMSCLGLVGYWVVLSPETNLPNGLRIDYPELRSIAPSNRPSSIIKFKRAIL